MSRVTLYRLVVFALAAFYFADRALAETYVLSDFGWQFRYLTIWALTMSLISAGLMLTPRFGGQNARAATFASLTAVVNMIVVVSYWRLYFNDPELVNGDNAIVAYREYYLHLIGPLLQWIDALVIKRAVRRVWPVAKGLAVLVVVYLLWAELVVAPLNSEPVGTVRAGLPYPFLNDMVLTQRLVFYGATFLSGLVFLSLLRLVQAALDWRQRAASSSASSAASPLR